MWVRLLQVRKAYGKSTTVREVGYPREKKGSGREAGPQIIGWCQQGGTISLAPQAPGRKVRCGEQILLGPSRNQSPETQSLYGVLRMLGAGVGVGWGGGGAGRRLKGWEAQWGVENAYFNAVLFVEDTSGSVVLCDAFRLG